MIGGIENDEGQNVESDFELFGMDMTMVYLGIITVLLLISCVSVMCIVYKRKRIRNTEQQNKHMDININVANSKPVNSSPVINRNNDVLICDSIYNIALSAIVDANCAERQHSEGENGLHGNENRAETIFRTVEEDKNSIIGEQEMNTIGNV